MQNILNSSKCFLIAEIGVNHNGDLKLARDMILAAKNSGADAVKFQTFKAEILASQLTPKVKYQIENTGSNDSHFQMLKKLELSYKDHFILKEYCDSIKIEFISTPYDINSAIFLSDDLGIRFLKTSSADIVDIPLQEYIASTNKNAIVSVGMASLGEIEKVCKIYDKKQNNNLTLLHCVSNYPCTDESLNLKVIKTLQQSFGVPVGYSDHSLGETGAIISIVYGAKIIEKHFTLDKNLPGPDHPASCTPDEFLNYSSAIRRAELMIGSSIKRCQPEEFEMSKVSRKSLHLSRNKNEGEELNYDDFLLMRPGTGLNYEKKEFLIGRILRKDLKKGHLIKFSDLL